jgi:hypothetical protein
VNSEEYLIDTRDFGGISMCLKSNNNLLLMLHREKEKRPAQIGKTKA